MSGYERSRCFGFWWSFLARYMETMAMTTNTTEPLIKIKFRIVSSLVSVTAVLWCNVEIVTYVRDSSIASVGLCSVTRRTLSLVFCSNLDGIIRTLLVNITPLTVNIPWLVSKRRSGLSLLGSCSDSALSLFELVAFITGCHWCTSSWNYLSY